MAIIRHLKFLLILILLTSNSAILHAQIADPQILLLNAVNKASASATADSTAASNANKQGLSAIATAIQDGFENLNKKLTELFRNAVEGSDTQLSTLMTTTFAAINTSLSANPQANAGTDNSFWGKAQDAIIAGYTTSPPDTKSNSIFSGAGSNAFNTAELYKNQVILQEKNKFSSLDYPYNPAVGIKNDALKDFTSKNLSFDALLAGVDEASDHYIATLLDTAHMPPSIQGYILEQYNKEGNPDKFKSKKDMSILYNDNGELVDKLQQYQTKRRKYLALQSAVISNLQAIKRMGSSAGNQNANTTATLQQLAQQANNIDQASAITIARLNLMTNIIIAEELSKRSELDQRTLSTLTLMLLQNLASTKMDMVSSTDGTDYKSVTKWVDTNFLGKKDTSQTTMPDLPD